MSNLSDVSDVSDVMVMVMVIGRVRKEKFFLLLKAMQPVFEKTLKGEVEVGRAEIIKVDTWI